MPFYIRNLFSFRKTTAAANAPPVAKQGRVEEVKIEQILSTKQRNFLLKGTRKSSKSIFDRIASPFKAIKTWAKARKARAQIKPIRKQIKNNIPNLKANIPLQLQDLVKETNEQEISRNYIIDLSDFRGTFTDQSGKKTPSESILTSETAENLDESTEVLSEHLINFCGGDKNQASTLSTLLTKEALTKINEQLRLGSKKLRKRQTDIEDVERDVRMMKNNTARIVIKQDYHSIDISKSAPIITIKTTIDVPRKNPSDITLKSLDTTPKLTELT